MRKCLAFLVVFLLFGFLSTEVVADVKAKSYWVNPSVGGYFFPRAQDIESTGFGGPLVGGGLGYSITPNWGVEATIDWMNTELESNNDTVNVWKYRLDALHHFMPEKKLVPYLAGGVGVINILYDSPRYGDVTKPFFNFGGGFKWAIFDYDLMRHLINSIPVLNKLQLRGDIRWVVYNDDQTWNNWQVTGGLMLPFGGKAKPAPTPPPPPPLANAPTPVVPPTTQPEPVVAPPPPAPAPEPPPAPAPKPEPVVTPPSPPPAPTPPPPPEVKPVKEVIHLNVQFDTAKADVKTVYYTDLKRVAEYMKKYPETTVTIEGNTDNVGGKKYNQKLSERRAESVKNYLVQKLGVDASKISSVGYGLTRPVAANKTPEGRQKNRRVDAVFR